MAFQVDGRVSISKLHSFWCVIKLMHGHSREDSIHNEQKRQGKLANQLFQESLMEVSALLERDGVPETRPAEAEL